MSKFNPARSPAPIAVDRISEPAVREMIRGCTLIAGIDMRTHDQHIFHGQAAITEAVEGRPSELLYSVLRFAVDFRTDEPERLATVVRDVKGSCDYSP